ncbi:MAG: GAF domain-containing protein [Planctomycetota bacterium]|nr:GAF domain-containing protein [Planctomycetota bacterium]
MSSSPSHQDFHEIESLIDELAELAKSAVAARDFHREMVERTVRGLAASGGAFWSANGDGFELEYQTNLPGDVATHAGHRQLLDELQHAEQSRSIGPRSGYWLNAEGLPVGDEVGDSSSDSADNTHRQNGRVFNPTDLLLLCCPVRTDDQTIGVVEVYQRPGASPTVQAGYLRFIETIAEIAGSYHEHRHLRRLEDRAERWQAYEEFTAALHSSLDANRTAYAIAGEGRRLIECDRLSVAKSIGRRCEVVAVSGVDSVNRRSNVIRAADRLASAVVAAGEPQWIHAGAADLPPMLQSPLDEYLKESPSRILGIIPLLAKPHSPAVADQAGRPRTGTPPTVGCIDCRMLRRRSRHGNRRASDGGCGPSCGIGIGECPRVRQSADAVPDSCSAGDSSSHDRRKTASHRHGAWSAGRRGVRVGVHSGGF